MREKTKVRVGFLGKSILAMVAVAGVVSLVAVAPGVSVLFKSFSKRPQHRQNAAVKRSVETLVQQGLLKRTTDAHGAPAITLTKQGKLEALFRGYYKENKTDKWDGHWRLVVFDVPERKRRLRSELRHAMNLYGFRQLQQSVWVYPHPCDDFIRIVKTKLGIGGDVLYVSAQYIEGEKKLKTEFNLR